MVACEQALYLGLTRDLFWAQVAAGGLGRDSRATARELGRERSTPPPILVPIALFSSLSRRGLGTRIEGLSRAKAPPAKR